MKKLLLLFVLAIPSFGAFSGTTHWDIRTTGSDSNGGGFNVAATGTDFSQQNSAQIAFTDLVVGGTTTQATSALNPFDSTSPGNIVNVISGSGCTVQRAQVVSVSGATATFDKSLGTAASTCTGNLGGAMLTNTAVWAVAISGNTVWQKSGTYTITAAFGSGFNINWIGYNATHDDINGANLARPLITSSTNSVGLYNPSGNIELMKNISMSTTAATPGIWGYANSSAGGILQIVNCKINGLAQGYCGMGGGCGQSAGTASIIDSEILNSTANGIIYGGSMNLKNSWIHANGNGTACNNAQIVSSASSSNLNLDHTILSDGPNCGINLTATTYSITVTNSDIANNTGTGINLANISSLPNVYIEGNIIYGNGNFGVSLNATAPPGSIYVNENGVGGNTNGNYSLLTGTNDVTLSANPFTSSTNFALNSTVGGGAAAKGVGFPGAFPGGTTTGSLDLGAVQSAAGSSGGTRSYATSQ